MIQERRMKPRVADESAPEIRRANARLYGGNARGALKIIEEYLESHPNDAPALFVKSRILYELGDRPSSLDARLKALSLKQASTDAAAIADMLIEDGMYAEAETLLKARLDQDDKQFTTRFTLARILLFSSRFIEADREIKKLYKLSADSPIVRADYLEALRLALLGDSENLSKLVDRLKMNKVQHSRLNFFQLLDDFIKGGDTDLFANEIAKLRHEFINHTVYGPLFRSISPEIFLGSENKTKREFYSILGSRLKHPKLSGVPFSEEETLLLRELFNRYQSAEFCEIDEENAGLSGDRVLRANPERKEAVEQSCLVKVGRKFRIAIEKEKMETFVSGILHPNYHPRMIGYAFGLKTAALRLSWASEPNEIPFSLRQVYQNSENSIESIVNIIDNLFLRVLSDWHTRNSHRRAIYLFKGLSRFTSLLKDRLEGMQLNSNIEEEVIQLPDLGIETNNPLFLMKNLISNKSSEKISIPEGIHHGDLNARNIILDNRGMICLIDFYKTSVGFQLLDAARLEVDLRYETLQDGSADEKELRWLDYTLANNFDPSEIEKLDVRYSLMKRVRVSAELRRVSMTVFGLSSSELSVLYSIALLITLIRLLKYGHLTRKVSQLILAEIADLLKVISDA